MLLDLILITYEIFSPRGAALIVRRGFRRWIWLSSQILISLWTCRSWRVGGVVGGGGAAGEACHCYEKVVEVCGGEDAAGL